MSEISVIIVSWNACDYLRDCLNSIRNTGGALIREVIVVDNASSDGSPDMVKAQFPEVNLVRASENLGFARANNLGIQRASGSLLALINSDVIVDRGCLQALADCLEKHPEVGLAGPRVNGRDGRLQVTCRRLPTIWNTACRLPALDRVCSRWAFFSRFQTWYWNLDQDANVEVLSGCFWVARREAVDEVGQIDERFFFYTEDVDWCKRFRDAGWKLMFVPGATATHFGGGSSSNAPLRFSIEQLRSNLTYWRKHHGSLGRCAFLVIAIGQHSLRFVARGLLKVTGFASVESQHKLKEHIVCLRWLLTGKGA